MSYKTKEIATARAILLCPPDWTYVVHENMGWDIRWNYGTLNVFETRNNTFHAMVSPYEDGTPCGGPEWADRHSYQTILEAAAGAIRTFKNYLDSLQRIEWGLPPFQTLTPPVHVSTPDKPIKLRVEGKTITCKKYEVIAETESQIPSTGIWQFKNGSQGEISLKETVQLPVWMVTLPCLPNYTTTIEPAHNKDYYFMVLPPAMAIKYYTCDTELLLPVSPVRPPDIGIQDPAILSDFKINLPSVPAVNFKDYLTFKQIQCYNPKQIYKPNN